MYQPKVTNTQKYSDSQGEHVVHPAKLILLDQPSDIYPIIISETEEIEVGDWVYNPNEIKNWKLDKVESLNKDKGTFICKHGGSFERIGDWSKILALPEQFSDKHLQAILDGKLKEGDDVLIKCVVESRGYTHTAFEELTTYSIYLDQQNHITLFPVQRSLEEAAKELAHKEYPLDSREIVNLWQAFEKGVLAGAQWAVKTNYKGE